MNSLTHPLDIDRLTTWLWTGGDLPDEPAAATRTIREWRRLGIDAIVDTRAEWSDEPLVARIAPGIAYLHAGVDDAGQKMPDDWFDTIVDFALGHKARGRTVVCHCHMGINRGPSAAFAVLLAAGWNPVEAIELIRVNRPIAGVGYAEDALDWWHRHSRLSVARRRVERGDLAEWRRNSPHDTIRIIRDIHRNRLQEDSPMIGG